MSATTVKGSATPEGIGVDIRIARAVNTESVGTEGDIRVDLQGGSR